MKTKNFYDYSELAKSILDAAEHSKTVCAVFHYVDTAILLKLLASHPDTLIEQIELETPDWDGYEDEYLITIVHDADDILWLHCCKAKVDGHYLKYDADCVFVSSDAHYTIVEKNFIEDAVNIEANLCDECDCDEEPDDDEFSDDDEDCEDEFKTIVVKTDLETIDRLIGCLDRFLS